MNDIQVSGKQYFMGKEIPVVYGGFGENQKCLCDKTIAQLHDMEIKHVRELVNRNINRFENFIDIINLKVVVQNDYNVMGENHDNLLQDLGYTKMQIAKADHIYLLSQRGYLKLVKIMDSDKAWDIYNQVLDEYFIMKEKVKERRPQGEELLALAVLEAQKVISEKNRLLTMKDQIIGELKPKADYTDKILQSKDLVTITQIAKDYGMSGSEMNKLLHNLKIQYKLNDQWLLYANHQGKGYTHSETVQIPSHWGQRVGVKMITKWTQKGRLFLYEKLKKNHVLPMIERENQLELI